MIGPQRANRASLTLPTPHRIEREGCRSEGGRSRRGVHGAIPAAERHVRREDLNPVCGCPGEGAFVIGRECVRDAIQVKRAFWPNTDQPMRDRRDSWAAAENIIPSASGAAKALRFIWPDLNVTGKAYRVPVRTGSIVELNAVVERATATGDLRKGGLDLSHDVLGHAEHAWRSGCSLSDFSTIARRGGRPKGRHRWRGRRKHVTRAFPPRRVAWYPPRGAGEEERWGG